MKRIFTIKLEFNDLPENYTVAQMKKDLIEDLDLSLNDYKGLVTNVVEELSENLGLYDDSK
jgi:hypothetical protein